uniref:hypothetical protein n=1 Tax=Francisella sp. XLW-1 TaxID=2610887 RepID=UPI00123CA56C
MSYFIKVLTWQTVSRRRPNLFKSPQKWLDSKFGLHSAMILMKSDDVRFGYVWDKDNKQNYPASSESIPRSGKEILNRLLPLVNDHNARKPYSPDVKISYQDTNGKEKIIVMKDFYANPTVSFLMDDLDIPEDAECMLILQDGADIDRDNIVDHINVDAYVNLVPDPTQEHQNHKHNKHVTAAFHDTVFIDAPLNMNISPVKFNKSLQKDECFAEYLQYRMGMYDERLPDYAVDLPVNEDPTNAKGIGGLFYEKMLLWYQIICDSEDVNYDFFSSNCSSGVYRALLAGVTGDQGEKTSKISRKWATENIKTSITPNQVAQFALELQKTLFKKQKAPMLYNRMYVKKGMIYSHPEFKMESSKYSSGFGRRHEPLPTIDKNLKLLDAFRNNININSILRKFEQLLSSLDVEVKYIGTLKSEQTKKIRDDLLKQRKAKDASIESLINITEKDIKNVENLCAAVQAKEPFKGRVGPMTEAEEDQYRNF